MDELITKRDAIEAVNDVLAEHIPTLIPWQSKIPLACALKIKALPPVQPKHGTLIIPLNESDFKSVKRIMLDSKPWCRTFYEDVPGEAHWIKSYTPDDGELYECDNCGVTWQFNDGGPEENEAYYCPKCGFKMVPKEGEEHEID